MEKFSELVEQLREALKSVNDGVAVINESLFNLISVYGELREDVDKLIENQKGDTK